MMVARESGVMVWARRRSSLSQARSGSGLARGAKTFVSALASGGSSAMTRSRPGSWPRIAVTLSACSAFETKTNRAPESLRMTATWSGGSVG